MMKFLRRRKSLSISARAAPTSTHTSALAPLRKRTLVILLGASFIIGLIAFAPARLFEGRANRALAPTVQLRIASGTLWNGRGALSLMNVGSGDSTAIPFSWRIDPIALLRLRAGVALTADSSALAGQLKLGLGLRSIELRDVNMRADMSLLAAGNPMVALLGPTGALQVDTSPSESAIFSYNGVPVAGGKLRLRADNLLLRAMSPRTLGSFDINVVLRDATADYQLSHASGPLLLDGGGSLAWAMPRKFNYSGIAAAADPDVLAPLRNVGRPLPDGRLQIDFQSGW